MINDGCWCPILRQEKLEDANEVIRSNGSPDSQWQKQKGQKD